MQLLQICALAALMAVTPRSGQAAGTLAFSPTATNFGNVGVGSGSNAAGSLVDDQLAATGGTGGLTGVLTASPSSVTFSSVPVGSTYSQIIQLKNTGTVSISISGATITGTGFKICSLTLPLTLAAGQAVSCTLKFAPTATGTFTGSATFTSNATDKSLVVSLSGSAVAATRYLSVTPTSLSFGNVIDGKSETLAVSLKNTGNSSVSVSGISVTGANITTSGGVSGATIAPGQTATLDVTFAPTTVETVSGSVAVTSTATDSPTKISVAGAGVSSTTHSVTLTWAASTSSGVAGYYVYRATLPSTTYSRLNSTAITGTKYVDGSVVAGDSYNYAVKTVSTSGALSNYSTPVTVAVP